MPNSVWNRIGLVGSTKTTTSLLKGQLVSIPLVPEFDNFVIFHPVFEGLSRVYTGLEKHNYLVFEL
ncbi:hypothetical protein [Shewanella piezotolerans]|uniref:hypothetical protein n=1 Tax=Shewanella piezotolerans TaxID=404011 RepID=UPI0005C93FFC|nr:hypothetical protein [Shewanella piezotolerans]